MNPDTIYIKTDKGRAQLETREGISVELRQSLILVDGKSTLGELANKWSLILESVGELQQLGLIAPVGADGKVSSPVSEVKRQLIVLAHELLGNQAGKVVAKIEAIGDTPEDLLAGCESCTKMIRLVIDEKKANAFIEAARKIVDKQVG